MCFVMVQEIQDNILTLYASQKDRSGKKLYDYFFKYKLVKLEAEHELVEQKDKNKIVLKLEA